MGEPTWVDVPHSLSDHLERLGVVVSRERLAREGAEVADDRLDLLNPDGEVVHLRREDQGGVALVDAELSHVLDSLGRVVDGHRGRGRRLGQRPNVVGGSVVLVLGVEHPDHARHEGEQAQDDDSVTQFLVHFRLSFSSWAVETPKKIQYLSQFVNLQR